MTHTAGPVPLASKTYIARRFEQEMLSHIFKGEWILLLGPRQHGKTSALIRIRNTIRESGLRCALVDLQGVPPALDFPHLLEWFARQIASSLRNELGEIGDNLKDSLDAWLNCAIPAKGGRIVILIDEASAIINEDIRNAFYGQIRALKSAAVAAEPGELSSIIQFVFSGTFRPESLVDERNSPFNVCRRIDTDDLDLLDVENLSKFALGREEVQDIANLIFDMVGGQPHLVQLLLSVVQENIEGDALVTITDYVENLSECGSDHLNSIFGVVIGDPTLSRIAASAAIAGQVLNDPANADYKFMTVIGLMRREKNNLIFRNLLYKNVALTSSQLRPEENQHRGIATHLYPIPITGFNFIVDDQYREICHAAYNGAVAAINAGSYRLAMVAFGSVLEGILVDFLSRQSAMHLTTTIGSLQGNQRPNFRPPHEVAADPSTWTLANQIKVARAAAGRGGPAEIPDALREMRNLIHPKVMKQNYRKESELQPEAVAASGLVAIAMRDLQ